MRTTREQVDGITARLAEALGIEYIEYRDRSKVHGAAEGSWYLDHASCYGGWMVYAVSGPHGGASTPLGERRRSASDHWDAMYVALQAVGLVQS